MQSVVETFAGSRVRVTGSISALCNPTPSATIEDVSEGGSKGSNRDVVLVHGRTEDGAGLRALRAREDRVSLAELRPLEEGKPLNACEIVHLTPRRESPLLFDVDVKHEVSADGAGRSPGPARVSNRAYREHWEQIFGAPAAKRDDPPN